ncbi:MAG: hydroxymethylglutaryl-CoA reductase, degradative [Chloroflexota bacterium]|nr:hydroxymethylglutaryl-CoA reductase, degradative [Chloroflexota bacterium]
MPKKEPTTKSSRLSGFYNLPLEERAERVAAWAGLTGDETRALDGAMGLDTARADQMIENVVGLHSLPLGIAVNFVVNGRDVLVPMAVEEPSVVAGASFAAKLARAGGGFRATTTAPEMIGQLQVLDVTDPFSARFDLLAARDELLALANESDPVIVELGGGARDLEVHIFEHTPVGPMLAAHLIFDCRDAMGANAVNTACESLAPRIERITGGRVLLRILSNLADRRLARARCTVPVEALAFDDFSGERVAQGIIEASAFAAVDPYRAATHNKGIMNGVDPIVIATGNDWRAVEAGAHAYAARSGTYTSLSTWARDGEGNLAGTLEMPLAVGIVGGATRVHPTAQAALKILGVRTACELAEVIVSVGLAQNLAALRALATEGIQRGHMRLHARQVAVAAGAAGDEAAQVVERMVAEGRVRPDRAEAILADLRQTQAKAASAAGRST